MSANRIGARAMIVAGALMLAVPAVAQTGDEVGGNPDPAPYASPLRLNDLDTQLHASVARMLMTDENVGDQYDGIWLAGLEVSFAMSPTTRFFLSGHYGSTEGDPYGGDPTFEGGDTRLRAAPFRAGLRLDTSANDRLKVDWSIAYQFVWVSEETPLLDVYGVPLPDDASGWTTGLFLGVAPEILWNEGRRSARLEIGWSGYGGDIGLDRQRHDITLTGVWVALGTTIRL